MQNNKGFGLIGVVAAVMVITVLAAAGYLFVQERQQENAENDQSTSAELSHQEDHDDDDHRGAGEWQEYRFDPYGMTFEYPADWQVEVTTVEGFEDQPNLLIKDDSGQLVTGIYGYLGDDDDCDIPAYDAENQPDLKIGQHQATLLRTCENVEKWIAVGTMSGYEGLLAITTNFLGQPQEEDARQLLESMTGLMPAIVN